MEESILSSRFVFTFKQQGITEFSKLSPFVLKQNVVPKLQFRALVSRDSRKRYFALFTISLACHSPLSPIYL